MNERFGIVIALCWVMGAFHFVLYYLGFFDILYLQLLWAISEFRVLYVSLPDVRFAWHYTPENAIRISFVGVIVPLMLSIIAIIISERERKLPFFRESFCIIIISALLFFIGSYIDPVFDAQRIGLGMLPILGLIIWSISEQKEEPRFITCLTIYYTSFLGFLLGDILSAIKNNQLLTGITGGASFGDLLWWMPFLFAFIAFYRKRIGFFETWKLAED